MIHESSSLCKYPQTHRLQKLASQMYLSTLKNLGEPTTMCLSYLLSSYKQTGQQPSHQLEMANQKTYTLKDPIQVNCTSVLGKKSYIVLNSTKNLNLRILICKNYMEKLETLKISIIKRHRQIMDRNIQYSKYINFPQINL